MISKFFIERPILANVIAVIFIVIGMICFLILPVTQYPSIVPPTIQVSTKYPGASADVIAQTVGIPIEQAVNGVENSLYLSSTSGSDGGYNLTITFAVGTDLNTSLTLVQNVVNGALTQLPEAVQRQGVLVKKVSTDLLQVVSLYSPDNSLDETFLSNYAIINLQNPLARLPGVGILRVVGAGPYSIRVWLDPDRLKFFNLTTQDVFNALRQQNVQVTTGQLGAPPVPSEQALQLTINTLGRLSDVEQFENIIVKADRNETAQLVRVRDLARVDLGQQYFTNFARMNGHKSSFILVYPLPEANAITTAREVDQAMAKMSQDFPQGMAYDTQYNTAVFVREAINAVYYTLFEAGFLVLIVIIVFLQNWQAVLVPATTIPVTIVGAFAAMKMLGFSINFTTLFALILAIGIVVDDAIVIVESTSYYIEKGLAPKQAAIKAMEEMTGPVFGITLALTSVFLPAAFLPGITGQLFRQFALVIASTAIISAVIAITLNPVQCALYLRPHQQKKANFFYRGFNRFYQSAQDKYLVLVHWMMHHPVISVVVFIVIISAASWFFAIHPKGFLPTEDQGYAIILGRLPGGAAQPQVKKVTEQLDGILKKVPGIRSWDTVGGFSVLDGANLSNTFTSFVTYQSWKERGDKLTQDRIIGNLWRQVGNIQDAEMVVLVPPPIQGLGQAGGFQMMIEDRTDLGLAELQKAVLEVIGRGQAQSGIRRLTTTFSNRSPQLYLDIDRTKAESLGVSMDTVFSTLQSYLGSSFVNQFNKFNQVFQVNLQADAPYRLRTEDIDNLYARNNKGQMVPLGTLLAMHRTMGPELVTRYNLYPAVPVFGLAAAGVSSTQALHLMENLAQNTLPKGMDYEWTATAYQEKQVGYRAYFIYALSMTLVFLVLAGLYESWTSPAAVILTVPLAIVGVLLALNVRQFDNNIYTQVGLVLMIALASKNAILIVEFARELRHQGLSINEAAVEATRRRFRPIVMTSFAFILGVVPLLNASGAGAANQQAIGTVVFGGMLSSTLLAIPFVPVFFAVVERFSEKHAKGKRKRQASNPAASDEPGLY